MILCFIILCAFLFALYFEHFLIFIIEPCSPVGISLFLPKNFRGALHCFSHNASSQSLYAFLFLLEIGKLKSNKGEAYVRHSALFKISSILSHKK